MNRPHLLVVDDDPLARQRYALALRPLDSAEIEYVATSDAVKRLREQSFDLCLARSGSQQQNELLAQLRAADASLPLLLIANAHELDSAAGIPAGATDVLDQSLLESALAPRVQRLLEDRRKEAEYELLRRQVERPYSFDDIIGTCPAMLKVFQTIEQVARSNVDVLIIGETGTGKELIARSIHRRSGRAAGPFVPVDCGAIPESLLESEFFGHERGSFTGADARQIGLLEFADGGTFFLDELGELPLLLQAKLLRTLQERKIRRVGGREEVQVDVRIVAATARQLEEMIRQERFRQDLYYRINVVRIELPPLRQRGDDIGLLAEYMANRYAREMGRNVRGITPEAYQVMAHYRWPGNVRELQNIIRRAIALSKGSMLGLDDLPDEIVAAAGEGTDTTSAGYFELRDRHLASFEQGYLRELLERHRGDVRTAAMEAKLPRGTLYRLLKRHGLDGAEFRSQA